MKLFFNVFLKRASQVLIFLVLVGVSVEATNIYASHFSTDDIKAYNINTLPLSADFSISGGGLDNTGSVAIGPDGNIYAISRSNMDILKFSPGGTFLGAFATNTGLVAPEDMTFGPDGNLYVVDTEASVPGVYSFQGTSGSSLGLFTTGQTLLSPFGLSFDDTGQLYVSDRDFNAGAVHLYDSNGGFISTSLQSKLLVASDLLNGAAGMTFVDEHLYITNHFDDNLLKYDPFSDTVTTFSSGLLSILDVSFANGNFYVTRFGTPGISEVDGVTGVVGPLFGTDLTFFPRFLAVETFGENVAVPEPSTFLLIFLSLVGGSRRFFRKP